LIFTGPRELRLINLIAVAIRDELELRRRRKLRHHRIGDTARYRFVAGVLRRADVWRGESRLGHHAADVVCPDAEQAELELN
jgi:hypothetical protein